MTEDLPDLTLILGPQTYLSLALNAHLRENRHHLRAKGITVLPSRLATPMLRRAIDERPEAERTKEFNAKSAPRPVILSAVSMLGQPQGGLAKGELFPDAEFALANLGPFVKQGRIVFAIDPLPSFFLAYGSEALEERVRQTSWEVLYELNWHEFLAEMVDILPDATFLILTGKGFHRDPSGAANRVLGGEMADLPQPYTMFRHMISETGHAVLDRMLTQGEPDMSVLADVHKSFAIQPTSRELQERLGIDRVTNILLEQRFEEDLEKIVDLPRVEVI